MDYKIKQTDENGYAIWRDIGINRKPSKPSTVSYFVDTSGDQLTGLHPYSIDPEEPREFAARALGQEVDQEIECDLNRWREKLDGRLDESFEGPTSTDLMGPGITGNDNLE